MEIHIINQDNDIRLPVNPSSFEISDTQDNETVVVHSIGEINLVGKPGLRTIELSSFFPHENSNYSFLQYDFNENPYSYIKMLKEWKDAGEIIELHIASKDAEEAESNVRTTQIVRPDIAAWDATIEELKFSQDDASGDVNYTLSLKEYRSPNGRVTQKTKTIKYTTKKGDTLKRIAYKYLGSSAYYTTIYAQNKKIIEKKMKKYIKDYNKKHPEAKLKYKSSQKGKHICKGIKLVISEKVV